MSLTTDPNDQRLGHGVDAEQRDQHEVYLVLSQEERAKGFVRPVRTTYRHVGLKPDGPLRPLTDEEKERHAGNGYVAFEEYPPERSPQVGRYWTQEGLDTRGCGTATTMDKTIAETYAREPSFYGSTYCMRCRKHLPVAEFVWDDDGTRVGS